MADSLLDNLLGVLVMLLAVSAWGWLGYRLVEQPALDISHRLRAILFDRRSRKYA
jgi:hypothetical protein